MTMPHYAEAFHPAVGRCFRFVSVAGTHGQPAHCPAPPAWRGLYVAGNGRGYRGRGLRRPSWLLDPGPAAAATVTILRGNW
jgi:hypothetical protein